jgi:hypothetical protein
VIHSFSSILKRRATPLLRVGAAALALWALASFPTEAQQSVLIPTGAAWKYLDNGSDQGTGWRAAAFNDTGWKSGPAELGYGDGDEATLVGYGSNSSAKFVTTYFRHTFSVVNPAAYGGLTLRVLRDDGAVVYLNGTEVFRTNMPAGTVTSATLASTALVGTDETTYVSKSVNPGLLAAGTNVLAVEIHQADRTSSDVSFNLELAASTSVTLTRGPYLQLGTPSSTIVRWRTSAPVVGRVQYGLSAGANTWAAEEGAATTEHQVKLTGLLPDTAYYYTAGTGTTVLAGGDATYFLRTAPVTGTSKATRVWVLGDSGTANANARAVRDAYYAFTGTRPTNLWLMLGDNAYTNGTDAEYQTAVFDMYAAMLRRAVLWPTLGNHDGYSADSASQTGPYYNIFTLPKTGEAGGLASGTEAYYSFDYANIHFVCLESFETNRSVGGPMLTWLHQDLASTTQPWVIAFFHHPPYSKGSHDSDVDVELREMRQNALPILENAGVDLVLSGHSHSYERSFLIDGHYGASSTFTSAMKKDGGSGREDGSGAYRKPTYGMAPHEGTVYAVAGSSGQASGGALNHPAMFVSLNSLGSMVLDVNGSRLDATFIDQAGVKRDYFTLLKGATSSGSTPYGGAPVSLPATVQAENFDEGASGVAYLDTTTGNAGGQYRTTDVDIESTVDTGGGYDVGRTRPGEWLKYSVTVATTGTYTLDLRLANIGTGARVHLEVDGVDRTGPIAVPNTGGWQMWRTVTKTGLSLTAGAHALRLVFDAGTAENGGAGNYNWLRFTPASTSSTPFGGTAAALPGTVQVENFDEGPSGVAYLDTTTGNAGGKFRTTNVDIEGTVDTGGLYNVGWTRPSEWLKYTVAVATTGTYTLDLRLANVGTGARVHLEIDGVDRTGPINVPNTGGWQTWQTITKGGLPLTAGTHAVRLVFDAGTAENGGAGNYNWVRFTLD